MSPAEATARLVELRSVRDRLAIDLVTGGRGEALAEALADALDLAESVHASQDFRPRWLPWWCSMSLRRRRLIRGLDVGLAAVRAAVAADAEVRVMAAGMAEASAADAADAAGSAQNVTSEM